MKVARVVEALALNVLLIAVLLWLNAEQAARVAYATGKGLSFVFSRSLFTYTTSLGEGSLTSPLTLDWVQVILVVLVLLDAYYLFGAVRSKRPSA